MECDPAGSRHVLSTARHGSVPHSRYGKPWLPLHSFRTDDWDWPESEDPAESLVDRAKSRAMQEEAAERCEFRRMEEARRAVEILKQREVLGKKGAKGG